MKIRLVFLVVLCCFAAIMRGQQDTSAIFLGTSISKFFQQGDTVKSVIRKVSVASLREQDIREATGSILVISHEEILASGARDIMEILMQVPGMTFGRDVDDAIGLGIRGLWAHEGKFMIMMNGLPLNELDFGTYAFGQRFSLNNISHIEIINGPGSVAYGGTAALGVINLITYSPGENDGTSVTTQSGITAEGISRTHLDMTGNHYLGNETFVSYAVGMTKGNKSNQTDPTFNGSNLNYKDSTDIRSAEILVKVQRKGLSAQFYTNDYNYAVTNEDFRVLMRNSIAELKYNKKLGAKSSWSIQPQYIFQLPWSYQNTPDLQRMLSNTRTEKEIINTTISTKWNSSLETSLGAQAYNQQSVHELTEHQLSNGLEHGIKEQAHHMMGASIYGDMLYRTRVGNFNVSARGELNNNVPSQLAPRFGYSKTIRKCYIKLSQAYAYKIPTSENIHFGPDSTILKVEHTNTTELQFGADLTRAWSVQLNIFGNQITDPIVYVTDTISLDNYINRKRIANEGIEFISTLQNKKLFVKFSYSFYRDQKGRTDLPEVQLPSSYAFQAMPQHKATASMRWKINKVFVINSNLFFQSGFSSFEYSDIDQTMLESRKFDAVLLAGIDLDVHPRKYESFAFRFGINNLLNSPYYIASPYSYGLDAIRMNGPEVKIQVSYLITK